MVDVSEKAVTLRTATAGAKVLVNPETFALIKEGRMKKGDVLGVAQVANRCVRCKGETGVEMEALTAASVAALTIYDMCKAVQKDIEITEIRLLSKTGGKSGDYNLR